MHRPGKKTPEREEALIEVLAGPRQVGKSTIIRDILPSIDVPCINESADAIAGTGEG